MSRFNCWHKSLLKFFHLDIIKISIFIYRYIILYEFSYLEIFNISIFIYQYNIFYEYFTSTSSIYRLLFIDIIFYTSFRISIWLIYLKIILKCYDILRNNDIKITRCPVSCRNFDIMHVDKWDISQQVEAQKRFRTITPISFFVL